MRGTIHSIVLPGPSCLPCCHGLLRQPAGWWHTLSAAFLRMAECDLQGHLPKSRRHHVFPFPPFLSFLSSFNPKVGKIRAHR